MPVHYLETISAISAVLAAALWISSSLVKTPRDFTVQVIGAHRFEPDFGEAAMVSEGYGTSKELEILGSALVRQSRLNAAAALCAALSAICHAIIILAPHL
jgi:hypothetical protein